MASTKRLSRRALVKVLARNPTLPVAPACANLAPTNLSIFPPPRARPRPSYFVAPASPGRPWRAGRAVPRPTQHIASLPNPSVWSTPPFLLTVKCRRSSNATIVAPAGGRNRRPSVPPVHGRGLFPEGLHGDRPLCRRPGVSFTTLAPLWARDTSRPPIYIPGLENFPG